MIRRLLEGRVTHVGARFIYVSVAQNAAMADVVLRVDVPTEAPTLSVGDDAVIEVRVHDRAPGARQ